MRWRVHRAGVRDHYEPGWFATNDYTGEGGWFPTQQAAIRFADGEARRRKRANLVPILRQWGMQVA